MRMDDCTTVPRFGSMNVRASEHHPEITDCRNIDQLGEQAATDVRSGRTAATSLVVVQNLGSRIGDETNEDAGGVLHQCGVTGLGKYLGARILDWDCAGNVYEAQVQGSSKRVGGSFDGIE